MKYPLGIAVFALLILSQTSCKDNVPEDTTINTTTFKVYRLDELDTTLQIEYVADVQAKKYIEIRNRQAGMLEEILIDEGRYVKQGETIFRFNPGEFEANYHSAKAAVLLATAEVQKSQIEAERVESLIENNVVAKTERQLAKAGVEIAKAKLEEAKANLELASTQLSYCTIIAPFSGKINRIHFKRGSNIEAGAIITTLSDESEIWVYFDLTEKDYLRYKRMKMAGEANIPKKVKLIMADGFLYPYDGEIETSETEFEENSGVIAFRARFPNPDGLLHHNSTGLIRMELPKNNVFLVPQKAVLEQQDRYFVFVVDKEGNVSQRAIVPESRLGNFYVVGTNLKNGEQIVYEGIQAIRDGDKIQFEKAN